MNRARRRELVERFGLGPLHPHRNGDIASVAAMMVRSPGPDMLQRVKQACRKRYCHVALLDLALEQLEREASAPVN